MGLWCFVSVFVRHKKTCLMKHSQLIQYDLGSIPVHGTPSVFKSCYLFKQSIQLRNHSPLDGPLFSVLHHNPSIDPHQSISVPPPLDWTHVWKHWDTVITVRGTLIRSQGATSTVRTLKLFIKTSREKTSSSHTLSGSAAAGSWRSNNSVPAMIK